MSRRTVLAGAVGLAAAGAALVATDRLDDVSRAVGARPKPAPDERDIALLRTARNDQAALISLAEKSAMPPELIDVLREQARGLGGAGRVAAGGESALPKALSTTIAARRSDAAVARSTDVAAVLASLSAGLAQIRDALGTMGRGTQS